MPGAARGSGSSNRNAGTVWTPLRENFFNVPLLAQQEKDYLVRKACEAAQEVVERARSTGGPIQWRHVEKYKGVQIYAGSPRGSIRSNETTCMCGVTTVPGTINEVAHLLELSTTRQMKEFAHDHRDFFFDAVVLYNLAPRTKEKPLHQVTAKWIAVKSPSSIEFDRDFCYLECQDKFIDSNGRKGWVLSLHSIKLPGCPELFREFQFVRGSLYHSGIVVVQSDRPGFVDLIHILQLNLKHEVTSVPHEMLRQRVVFINQIHNLIKSKRLNEQRYLSDLELVPKKCRSRCSVCQDSFSLLLLRKLHCRKCGDVVCSACSKEFEISSPKILGNMKLRICMHCYNVITTAGTSEQDQRLELMHERATSLLNYQEDSQRASFMTQLPLSADQMMRELQQPTRIYLQSLHERRRKQRDRPTMEHLPPMVRRRPSSSSSSSDRPVLHHTTSLEHEELHRHHDPHQMIERRRPASTSNLMEAQRHPHSYSRSSTFRMSPALSDDHVGNEHSDAKRRSLSSSYSHDSANHQSTEPQEEEDEDKASSVDSDDDIIAKKDQHLLLSSDSEDEHQDEKEKTLAHGLSQLHLTEAEDATMLQTTTTVDCDLRCLNSDLHPYHPPLTPHYNQTLTSPPPRSASSSSPHSDRSTAVSQSEDHQVPSRRSSSMSQSRFQSALLLAEEQENQNQQKHHRVTFSSSTKPSNEPELHDHDRFDPTAYFSAGLRPLPTSNTNSNQQEDEGERERLLLSARSLFRSFGSTKKLEHLVGSHVRRNTSVQQTFADIQQSIELLSSDEEDCT